MRSRIIKYRPSVPHCRGEKVLESPFPTREPPSCKKSFTALGMCPTGFWRFQMFQGLLFGFADSCHGLCRRRWGHGMRMGSAPQHCAIFTGIVGNFRSKKRQKSRGWLSCVLWWLVFGGEPIFSGSGCSPSVIIIGFLLWATYLLEAGEPRNMKDHPVSALVLHFFP